MQIFGVTFKPLTLSLTVSNTVNNHYHLYFRNLSADTTEEIAKGAAAPNKIPVGGAEAKQDAPKSSETNQK